MMGDEIPPDELNYAPRSGMHFGFPYCHGKDISDPEFGHEQLCVEFVPPALTLPAHVAALGMRFYTGTMFPPSYQNQIFVAEHGSWNRTNRTGYRISLIHLNENNVVSYEVFASGSLQGQFYWGHPWMFW